MKLLLLLIFLVIQLVEPTQLRAEPSKQFENDVLEVIRKHPELILETVTEYQRENVYKQRQKQWELDIKHPVSVNLEGSPILGNPNAPLTLVIFSDFQCPYCQKVQPTLKLLLEKYKDTLRIVYLHLPLQIHAQARSAAWAAGQQGQFFKYHDRLFSLKGNLQPDTYVKIANEIGLNITRFTNDFAGSEAKAKVRMDMLQANQLGIEGTPGFVLNGLVLQGALPLWEFEEAITFVQQHLEP